MSERERVARALFGQLWPGFRWDDLPVEQLEVYGRLADAALLAMSPLHDRAARLVEGERDLEVDRLGGWERVHASALLTNWVGGFTTVARILRGDEPRPAARDRLRPTAEQRGRS